MRSKIAIAGLALLLLVPGCDEDNLVAPTRVTELPRTFRLTGTASGTDSAGFTASCALDLVFELTAEASRTGGRVNYAGVHGGEVERTVLAGDGSGFAFHADVYGEVEAHLFVTGGLEILIPVNETAEGRFWRNLARFAGSVDSSGRGQGRWTCAPFDIDSGGYVDESVIAEGTWQTEPSE
jgi:hypothetical protein